MELTRIPSMLRVPSLRAAAVQLISFGFVLALAHGLSWFRQIELPLAVALLLQGALAAGISCRRRLAPWWIWMQALFPFAVAAVLFLRLPPALFLIAFLLLLGLYWSTFRTQVPYYPSGRDTWQQVSDLLPDDRPVRFIDIGSGLGGLVLELARERRDGEFTGIELAPLPWLWSFLRARLAAIPARFVRGDYDRLDFGSYDVIFAYLSPAAMPALWEKARAEMRPGTLLLSCEFRIPHAEPHAVSEAPGGRPLYVWRM